MKRRTFIKSISALAGLITSSKLYSANKLDETDTKTQSSKLSDSYNHEDSSTPSIVLLGAGQSAGRILHDLNRIKLDQYNNSMTGQQSSEIEYSFIDACFPANTAQFYWRHDFPEELSWHTYDYINETEEISLSKYKVTDEVETNLPEFLNRLAPETAARLGATDAAMRTEMQFDRDVYTFIENNHKFRKNQIVVFIYDVFDQSARRLIKPLLKCAKENDVYMSFSISLRPYVPNLSTSDTELFHEIYRSSRLGERYADFHQLFRGRPIKHRHNKQYINDWYSGYDLYESPVDKIKCIIDAISSLSGSTSLIASEVCDFTDCFKGFSSAGLIISKYDSNPNEGGSSIAKNICDIHRRQSHNPVFRMLINIVGAQSHALEFYDDIITSIDNNLGCVYLPMINFNENLKDNTAQVTIIAI